MVRILMCCLLSCLLFACRSGKEIPDNKKATVSLASLRDKYKVTGIDSLSNVFVVYAKKDSVVYKIVSLKDTVPCNRISVGQEYPFQLLSIVPKEFKGINISPDVIPHLSAIDFHGVSIPFERNTHSDVFVVVNLKGLCY